MRNEEGNAFEPPDGTVIISRHSGQRIIPVSTTCNLSYEKEHEAQMNVLKCLNHDLRNLWIALHDF